MITIISLAWNQYKTTKEFLERLKKYTDIDHELIFTDNGSEEPISELVKEIYPDAILVREDKNIGCPATRNKSMKLANNNIVFWLDNDTMVDNGWYIPFLNNLKGSVGITGIDGRCVGNPFNAMFPWDSNFDVDCDWFVGYAVAFKKEAYKPINDWGLMVNMDDVDLGVGIKRNGYRAKKIREEVPLVHLTSVSAKSVQPNSEKQYEVLVRWWRYWIRHKKYFEKYKYW
jgi:GT2 family glycosyltransferase